MSYKVLMTGAGAPGGPGIIKSLLRLDYIDLFIADAFSFASAIKSLLRLDYIDLFIADANENASGKYLLPQKFSHIPVAEDPDFCKTILDLCIQKKINLVFPLVTKELIQFSQNLESFHRHGVQVIVSGYQSLSIAVNKCRLYEHLGERQVELPKFKTAKNYPEFLEAIQYIGYPGKPFCVKPGFSNGSRGVRIVDGSVSRFDLLFNYKPGTLYSNFHELDAVLKEDDFPELLISEVLPGSEVTVDTIINKGKIELVLPRKRLKMISGITVTGEFFYDDELIDYTKRILKSLELEGPVGIQLRENADGDYRILEINPRIQGTSVAAMGLGINLPGLAVRNALNLGNKYPGAKQIRWGTKFFRFYDEVFY